MNLVFTISNVRDDIVPRAIHLTIDCSQTIFLFLISFLLTGFINFLAKKCSIKSPLIKGMFQMD